MASVYNLKRQIAAHHQNDKPGPFRIHMGGKKISMGKGKGAAATLIGLMPEEAVKRLTPQLPEGLTVTNPTPEAKLILGLTKSKKEKVEKIKEEIKEVEEELEEEITEVKEPEFTEEKLNLMSFTLLRKLAWDRFELKGRGKEELIREILEVQGD